jgi:hypothetical protein
LDAVSLVKDLDHPQGSSLEKGIKLAVFKKTVKKLENKREAFVNLQSQFRNKLETVKSLRDGVGIPLHQISTISLSRSKRSYHADWV